MSLVGYQARNHPQQVAKRGADSGVDDRAITMEDFAPLHARFAFTIDAAANCANARLPRYWTAEDDALEPEATDKLAEKHAAPGHVTATETKWEAA